MGIHWEHHADILLCFSIPIIKGPTIYSPLQIFMIYMETILSCCPHHSVDQFNISLCMVDEKTPIVCTMDHGLGCTIPVTIPGKRQGQHMPGKPLHHREVQECYKNIRTDMVAVFYQSSIMRV